MKQSILSQEKKFKLKQKQQKVKLEAFKARAQELQINISQY